MSASGSGSARPRPSRSSGSRRRLRAVQELESLLPGALSRFIGREEEIADIADLLDGERLVTLTGPPGIGKTRLAVEVAGQVAGDARFGDGARLAELAAFDDPALLPAAVASALGVSEVAGRSLTDAVRGHLRGRHMLLVLDNCEHLIAACAELVDDLLRACPGLVVLATSREALGVAGERVWQVSQLRVPAPGETRPEALMDSEAVLLFVDRARAVKPAFALNGDVAPAVGVIARRLEGIALAIELAAARVDVLTPAEIASRLDDRFALLTRGSRSDLPRHQSLQAALNWSHDLLSGPQRALLRRLSVFTGGFCLEAAETVCAEEDIPRGDVLDLLAGLVSRSLVVSNTANSRGRYRLLETVRAYAADRLAQSGEQAALGEAHARFYLAFAERAEPELAGPRQLHWFDRLDAEHENLRRAVEWSIGQGNAELALRVTGALVLFWRVRCRFSEGRELLESAALAASDADDPRLRMRVRWGVGSMLLFAGDHSGAQSVLEESLAHARALPDPSGCARALLMLGGNAGALRQGRAEELPAQLATLEESATLARQAGDRWCLSHALGAAGYASLNLGELPAAREPFEQGLAVAREAADAQGLCYSLLGLARVAARQGDYGSARPLFDEALTNARRLGMDLFVSDALESLGEMALGRGDYDAARALATDAGETLPAVSPAGDFLDPIMVLARTAQAQGDDQRALDLVTEGLRGLGPGRTSFPALQLVGELFADQDKPERARERFEAVLEWTRASGSRWLAAQALNGLGRVARSEGNLKRAARLHDEALELQHQLGEKPAIATTLELIGGLAAAAGRGRQAAVLLGAANALRKRGGYARHPDAQARYEADLDLIRRALGPEALTAALESGAPLSVGEAVARASRDRKRASRPAHGWESLTSTEHRVAELVAQGLSNPQVAERLVVSRSTVKTHLLHIFSKLGVSTRRELELEFRRRRDASGAGDSGG